MLPLVTLFLSLPLVSRILFLFACKYNFLRSLTTPCLPSIAGSLDMLATTRLGLPSLLRIVRQQLPRIATSSIFAARPALRASTGTLRTFSTVAKDKSLAAIAPELAAQWHQTKNGDVTPADIDAQTHKFYWWLCDAGPDHEWEARPDKRVGKGIGNCPFCSGNKVSVTNSLATMKPSAAAFWDVARNQFGPEDVIADSKIKCWFTLPGKGPVLRALNTLKLEKGGGQPGGHRRGASFDHVKGLAIEKGTKNIKDGAC
jgi:hypothetical protein